MGNPFVIGFGIKPELYIPMQVEIKTVQTAFNATNSRNRAYVIVGVRGSGKTVLMTEITKSIGNEWIVINLSSQVDLLGSLASQLYSEKNMHKLFLKAKFDFSFMGLGVHTETSVPAYDYQTAISMMLGEAFKQHKKILITIDEVANTAEMRKFASIFQIFIRDELPIFLLMAGTPENVKGLTDEKKSTFLLRTPRIEMPSLNYSSIRRSYMRTLKVSEETGRRLAHMTKGYAFAYQVLGSACWGKTVDPDDESFDDILEEYDRNLQDFSYLKIWEEQSAIDKKVIRAVAESRSNTVKDIREILSMESKVFNVYRDRLKRKGLLDTSIHGEVSFTLPRFAEFVIDQP